MKKISILRLPVLIVFASCLRKVVCGMPKKIFALLLLSMFVTCFPGFAYGSDETIYECSGQLMEKYPNVETIKEQFGDEAKWLEETCPSIHDDTLELRINNMEYPGIEIRTLGYDWDEEYRFFITLMDVKKEGFVEFLGIGIGSGKEDVIKKFGEPDTAEENELIYHDEAEYNFITFTFEDNRVTEMKFVADLD